MTTPTTFTVTGSACVTSPHLAEPYTYDFHYTAQALDAGGVAGAARVLIEEDAYAAAGLAGVSDYHVIITRFTVQEAIGDQP